MADSKRRGERKADTSEKKAHALAGTRSSSSRRHKPSSEDKGSSMTDSLGINGDKRLLEADKNASSSPSSTPTTPSTSAHLISMSVSSITTRASLAKPSLADNEKEGTPPRRRNRGATMSADRPLFVAEIAAQADDNQAEPSAGGAEAHRGVDKEKKSKKSKEKEREKEKKAERTKQRHKKENEEHYAGATSSTLLQLHDMIVTDGVYGEDCATGHKNRFSRSAKSARQSRPKTKVKGAPAGSRSRSAERRHAKDVDKDHGGQDRHDDEDDGQDQLQVKTLSKRCKSEIKLRASAVLASGEAAVVLDRKDSRKIAKGESVKHLTRPEEKKEVREAKHKHQHTSGGIAESLQQEDLHKSSTDREARKESDGQREVEKKKKKKKNEREEKKVRDDEKDIEAKQKKERRQQRKLLAASTSSASCRWIDQPSGAKQLAFRDFHIPADAGGSSKPCELSTDADGTLSHSACTASPTADAQADCSVWKVETTTEGSPKRAGVGEVDGERSSPESKASGNSRMRPGDHRRPEEEWASAEETTLRYRSPSAPSSLITPWTGRMDSSTKITTAGLATAAPTTDVTTPPRPLALSAETPCSTGPPAAAVADSPVTVETKQEEQEQEARSGRAVAPLCLPAIFKPGHLRTPDDRGTITSPRKSSPRMGSPRLGVPVMGGSCIVDNRGALADRTKAERWQLTDAIDGVMPRNCSDDRLPGDVAKSAIVRVNHHDKLRKSRERTWNDVRDWQVTEMILQAHKHQRMKSVEFSVRWLGSTALKDYSTLPQPLVRRIFEYFGPIELMTAATVCRRWRELADEDGLWREVYQRWFWGWTWDSSRVRREHPGDHPRRCRWKDFFLENCFLDRTQGYRILSGEADGLEWTRSLAPYAAELAPPDERYSVVDAPQTLVGHSATAVGDAIYVMMLGAGQETADSRLLVFNTRSGLWHRPHTTGPSPLTGPDDEHHTCCAVGHRLFVFGLAGEASPTHFSSLHVLDTRTLAWTREVQLGDAPPMETGHTVGQARHAGLEVAARFVSGGANGLPPLRRDTHTLTWQKVSLPESVSGGGYLSLTTAGHNVILCGGGGGRSAEAPSLPGHGYSTTKVGHWLFVFGGSRERASPPTNHLNLLNLETMSWYKTRCLGEEPLPRTGHTATLVGTQLYVMGGTSAQGQAARDGVLVLHLAAFPDVLLHHQKSRKKAALTKPVVI